MPATLIRSIYRGWKRFESYFDTLGMNENLKFIGDHFPSIMVESIDPEQLPQNPKQGTAVLYSETGQYRVFSMNANDDGSGWTLYPPSKGMVVFFDGSIYGNTGYSWVPHIGGANNPASNSSPVSSLPQTLWFYQGINYNINFSGLYFTDPDGDTLTFTSSGLPSGLSLSSSGVFSGLATVIGFYVVSITANDGKGKSVTGTSTFEIREQEGPGVNNAPTGSVDNYEVYEGVTVNINYATGFNDPDGDPLTFSATGLPAGLSISSAGLVSGVTFNVGDHAVNVTASDNNGKSVTRISIITVLASVGPPLPT